ncbi:MAG: hypothetical protein ACREQY_23820 [Candidatus Binatia bacterium]
MSARQGRLAVAATVVILSVLLFHKATVTGNWVGFIVTEVGLLAPMGVSWWILSGGSERSRETGEGER